MDAKQKKIVIVSSIIGLAIATGTIIWIRSRKIKELKKKLSSGNTDILGVAKTTDYSVIFPLKYKSGYYDAAENNAVKVVQRYLNMKIAENPSIGYDLLTEDGKFGPLTENACRRITGSSTVSYSLYKTIQQALVPKYLSPNTGSYTGLV